MKAAGAAGVIGGGFASVAGANEVDTCEEANLTGEETCDDCHKHCSSCAQQGSCTVAVDSDCEEITGSRVNVGGEKHCHEVAAEDIPNDATTAVIKAANDCWVCEVIDPTTDQTFCIDGKHGISHIEFARCPDATISADCPNDRGRIDVDLTDSVYFEVSYRDCDGDLDEPTSGTLTFEDDAAGGTSDDWHTFLALADCEGTITVWNAESKETKFDTTEFDCESGTVDADCEADAITVFAEDTTDLWYEIDFVDCEAEAVDRTSVSGLDSADTVTVLEPIPNCRGTVTLFEDETSERPMDSDTFNCVSATVSVDCTLDETGEATATIESPDTDTVWYAIDYDNCDVADVSEDDREMVDLSGSTDSATVSIAECDGTIKVYDAETGGNLLDSSTIDCADATASVACNLDETGEAIATIVAPDTDPVWYAIDYDDCDASDVDRTRLDLPGTIDSATFGIAECDGTITVFDAAEGGTRIASADINCADAAVSVACNLDETGEATATIEAPDTDRVWYTTSYTDCDDGGVTRKLVELPGTTDTATVDIAECDGTIEVFDAETGGDKIASAEIDCADAEVSVACTFDDLDDASATISAPDADRVWYAIDYDDCDVADVPEGDRTMVDLPGSTDSATFDIAECDGTIRVFDAETGGDEIASAEIDCADAAVSVDCTLFTLHDATATIDAPDLDRAWYAIDYDDCDVADVPEDDRTMVDLSGDTTSTTFDIAECDGTINVYDAETGGDKIVSAEIDCADAAVSVDCEVDTLDDATATIEAPDTDQLWYTIDYDNCDVDDVPRTKVDLPGSTDSVTFDIAECDGTIRVFDAAEDGTEVASTAIACADADVSVACTTDAFDDATATIDAPDLDTVWYTTTYENCDASGVTREPVSLTGSTDSATFDVAECDGTIGVYDAASGGDLVASADIDCADAQVTVDCVAEAATITAPDTDVVEYEIVYSGECTTDSVPRTEITLGDDDEATVSVADCAGTINVYDLGGDLLATADFDCVPEVTGLGADCETITADFTDSIASDQVRIDVDVKQSDGSSVATLSSSITTMESGGGNDNVTVNDTDGDGVFEQVVYSYSNELSSDATWQSVDVSVFLVDQNRFLDVDPDTGGFQDTRTFEVGPCGCPDCPSNLEPTKFDNPELCQHEGEFTITEIDDEGDPSRICFVSETPYCELKVCVKAGLDQFAVEGITPSSDADAEDCDSLSGDEHAEYCFDVSDQTRHGISHFTVRCPESQCDFTGPGSG